jgi:hypothetical protein
MPPHWSHQLSVNCAPLPLPPGALPSVGMQV